MLTTLYLSDRDSPAFETSRKTVDVGCAGDSITGWNNFGGVRDWPYRTYPEFLQRFCDPLGLTVANGGIAGEVSPNGLGQVRDYLDLFPNARYFVVGYGTNDLGMWPEVKRTSPRIIENLDRIVREIRDGGRQPILLNVPYANESMFPRRVAEDAPHEGLPQQASDSALPGEPRPARRYSLEAPGRAFR
jgi:lysophospholipase L1-like esterase